MPTPVQLDGLRIDGEEHALVDTKARAALTDAASGQSFKFGVDANGNFGYHKTVGGADTVIPFKTVKEQTKTITTNGTYNAKVTDNVDGYAEVDVQVSGGGNPPVLDSLAITQNTQAGQPITPPTGVDGYNSITVNVTPNVDRKVITGTAPFSQTFTASQQATPLDGYSQVQVNITGGSASTLVSKTVNIGASQNHQTIVLDPTEESPAADGYSDVTLVVDVPTSGGNCNIRTQAQWDALTNAEKRSLGLTVIRDSNTQTYGFWRNMTNAVIDIIKEFFNDVQETISMQSYAQQSIPHLIYMQGRWQMGGAWDCTVIDHSNLTYDSVDTGNINVNYTGFNNKLITILHDVTVGSNTSITVKNGYGGVTDGGGVFAIPFNSTAELIGEHYGSTADSFTTNTSYDFVLFISNKWAYGQDSSNGVYTIDAGTLIQTGNERLAYVGSSDYATAIYENVPSGTTITLGNGKTGAEDSIVAIGINEISASSEYLLYSSLNNIICEAHINNFDATSNSWGTGNNPLILSNTLTANSDGVGVDINANGGDPDYVYCDLGATNTNFTAYLVVKYSTYYNGGRLIDSAYSDAEAFIRENSLTQVSGGTYYNNVVFGTDHTSGDYIVIALRNNNNTVSVFKNGVKGTDQTNGTAGQYIALGSSYPYGNTFGANITVAYAGVVNEAETDDVINANMIELMRKFNIT